MIMESTSVASFNLSTVLLCAAILSTAFWYFFYWYDEKNRRAFKERNLKYVNLGNMFFDIIMKRRIELKKDNVIKKEGKVFGFNMLGKPTILLAEPELIQTVLSKEFTNFINRRPVKISDPILSRFLTLAEDDTWKRLRSVMTPTFSAGKLKRMKPVIDQTVATLLENIGNAIDQNEVVDLKEVVGAYTMDTIIQFAFGIKINSLIDKENPILRHAKMVFSTNFTMKNLFGFTMVFLFPRIAKALNVRINQKPVDFFHKITLEIIKKKRAEMAAKKTVENAPKASNFIELLLEAEVESDNAGDQKPKFITNDEIVAQAVIFFIVGYDTTATTITMVIYLLALHPEVQERLFEEINQVIEKLAEESPEENDPFKLVTLESLPRFKYLNAVLNETTRLYGPLVFLERVAAKDIRLETADGKLRVDVKKDDVIHVPGYSVHRDPEQFPDPEKFDPERFLAAEPTFHKWAFIPFGNGPRSCIAKSLALLESKMAILHMVRNFKFSTCKQTKIPVDLYYQSNLIIPRDVRVKVERRA